MCGAAAWARSASMLSHFSITRNASGPHLVWNGSAFSESTAPPYSMQPFSARTAGTLALKCLRISPRLPGLAVMTATTWIMTLPSLQVVDRIDEVHRRWNALVARLQLQREVEGVVARLHEVAAVEP